jgi:hypothetical protein
MNQTSQFAPTISCGALKAQEIAQRTLDPVLEVIRTIRKAMATLEGLFAFSGTSLQSAALIDRSERDDLKHPQPTLPVHEKISSYGELQKLVHQALRLQHPEWIGLDGESEMCEFYEARLAKLLGRAEPNK